MTEDLNQAKRNALTHFLEMESSLDLFAFRENGIPVWELIRYPLHRELLVALNIELGSSDSSPRNFAWLRKRLSFLAASFTYRRPTLAKHNGILIFGHPRRVADRGSYTDIYTDPLLPHLPADIPITVLEPPLESGIHRTPPTTHGLLYLDMLFRAATRLPAPTISADCVQWCGQVSADLADRLGVNMDIQARASLAVTRWTREIPVFRDLFRKVSPLAILLVVSAENETIVAAARAEGIPVAELQHGSPAPGKLNYDYPRGQFKETFPDYFLSFGPAWRDQVSLPLPNERVLPIGFSFMTAKRAEYDGVERRHQLLVISQPPLRHQLVDFVLTLRRHFGDALPIVFRLHPQDLSSFVHDYAQLEPNGITVADASTDLYRLFAESRWQLGVYSTAIYEGLAFGCTTYILNAPGAEYMKPLIDAGFAKLVAAPADVDLDVSTGQFASDELFQAVESETVKRTIKAIIG